MSVPIALSPGRSGFAPQLSLTYDSGAGNGPFGFGWQLSLPRVTRKTDKGLPRYRDRVDSDIFILSGAEDLVPVLGPDSVPHDVGAEVGGEIYTIRRYRPRIETLAARIERWTRQRDGDVHWRSYSRENVLTLYGLDAESRIADPDEPSRVFEWLICESRDDRGNATMYSYQAEDERGIEARASHERNRGARSVKRYLKRIVYGNRHPLLDEDGARPLFLSGEMAAAASWLFEVVFDYDEGHFDLLPLDPGRPEAEQYRYTLASASGPRAWSARPDPFSSYRATFEVRTYRRCHRVLMFHRFDELGPDPTLVRSTEFDYADLDYAAHPSVDDELGHQGSTRLASFIVSVTQSGYVRDDTRPAVVRDGATFCTYLKKSLPPVEFRYSKALVQDVVHELDGGSLENMPAGLDASRRFHDLDGEGVSGVLVEEAGAWFYKPNLGGGRLGALQLVTEQPSLAGARTQLLDLSSEGRLDLVDLSGPVPGFYHRTIDQNWEPFRPFTSVPNVAWDDPDLHFVDLTGDGLADVMIARANELSWYRSLGGGGFGAAERTLTRADEERGPRLVAVGPTEAVFLADLSGDGLADLVRVRCDEICYWPNLGYGRFGAKVTMDDAPQLDYADQFDPRRVRLADIDGSGTSDVVYLGGEGVRLYFNLAGNRWSGPRPLAFPPMDDVSTVQAIDLLGNGTACLVWSTPLPAGACPLRYVDLMGGGPPGTPSGKPHLLVEVRNNLGAETRIRYVSSAAFYLADKAAGRPWITRLPFPVHVVERVETDDFISRNRFVARYAYHHGFFDGEEREFRGFGMVEQWDTQELAALIASGELPSATNLNPESHLPPVHTKTWFHTGVYLGSDRVSTLFAGDAEDFGDYYREPGLADGEARALLLPDSRLPEGLSPEEEREACRALKGMMLRQEVFADDRSPKQAHPYTVIEQNFEVLLLQRRTTTSYASFRTHASESVTFHYERDPADPRVAHRLTLEVDAFGNVLKEATLAYPRRHPDVTLSVADRDVQAQVPITYSESDVTDAVDTDAAYRTPLASEMRTFELTGYPPSGNRFTPSDFVRLDPGDPSGLRRLHVFDSEIAYEQRPSAGRQRRLIEASRTLYRANDLTALLALRALGTMALPGESYKLAFTSGLIAQVLLRDGQPLVPDPALTLGRPGADAGGYVDLDGDGRLWIPSGRVFFSDDVTATPAQELATARSHFFVPRRYRDPFGFDTTVTFDGYNLLPVETRDGVGNRVTAGERDTAARLTHAGNDYRVLQPAEVMDANRNRTAAAFDALGLVVGTAVMGTPEERLGDSLDGFTADLTDAVVIAHLAHPLADPGLILVRASTRMIYDLFAYVRESTAAAAYTVARQTHDADTGGNAPGALQHHLSYSDGFGREIQKKAQAEAGPVPKRDATGEIVTGAADGLPQMTANHVSPRWVGSGWVVFNNKGKPVRQYEPFFTDTHRFEFDVRIGLSPVIFYDPPERIVGKLHPDRTWEKVVLTPWQQETWDVTDTVSVADPSADPDVGAFIALLPVEEWSPTWYAARATGAMGSREHAAAGKAAAHAGTPTVAHVDMLGRTFLTIAHNRFVRGGVTLEEFYATRVEFDIEGNQRAVRDAVVQNGDALGRVVARYDYDMRRTRIHESSMEANERWTLNDATGKQLRAWDSRGHAFRSVYDPLRRPVRIFVTGADPARANAELLTERIVYGEQHPDAGASNLRGRPCLHFDQAGVLSNDAYDFKGNLVRTSRRTAREYRTAIDWSTVDAVVQTDPAAVFSSAELDAAAAPLVEGTYTTVTSFDAFNRPLTLTTPDGSIVGQTYNEAGLLGHVDVRTGNASRAIVSDIDYDAKGRRTRVAYANGAATTYAYDPRSSRLASLRTMRGADVLQDLSYVYDPVGNVTSIADTAQQTLFFANAVVTPDAAYTYDAVYRLIQATGREHIGQQGQPLPWSWNDAGGVRLPHPQDGAAMRSYVERYEYDAVGNILRLAHQAVNGSWAREYSYGEPSLLERAKTTNRLSGTTIGAATVSYQHDAHGNMTAMPHLPTMRWDSRDRLCATATQVRTDGGTPKTTFYAYDAAGTRVRKITEREAVAGQVLTRVQERLYVGVFEIYREYATDGTTVALARQTLNVMDDKRCVAMIETRTVGDDPAPATLMRYQLENHLGSVSLELDDVARVISYEEYAPYGSSSYQAVRSQTETPKRYRYTGKERDDETGLSQHGARYYACWLGRWSSADPGGLVDGPNLYRYARASPVVLNDPNGHQPAPDVGPEEIMFAATALQRAAQAWGTASLVAGGAATGAAVSTPAVATGEVATGLVAGDLAAGAPLAGGMLAASVAMMLALRLHMQRSGSIARYGNPYGMPARDIAFPVLKEIQRLRTDPFPVPDPLPEPAPDKEEKKQPKPGRVYATYTKYNKQTGRYYSGRTSAVIDLNLPWRPQAVAAVQARDLNHHIDENDEPTDPNFGPADLDQFSVGYAVNYAQRYRDVGYSAIRGREQQLIDYYGQKRATELGLTDFRGGAQSDTKPGTPLTENTIRAVSKDNPLGEVFHAAANLAFGVLAPFTGDRIQPRQAVGR
jgi:RHS repeat-associated protein